MCASPPQEPRLVALRKKNNLFGVGINFAGDGKRVYVTGLDAGGAADLSGKVRKGDVVLRVNDEELEGSAGLLRMLLEEAPDNSEVELLLQYRPDEYLRFEEKRERREGLQKQEFYTAIATGLGVLVATLLVVGGVFCAIHMHKRLDGMQHQIDRQQHQIDQQQPPVVFRSNMDDDMEQFALRTAMKASQKDSSDLAEHIQKAFDAKFGKYGRRWVCLVGSEFSSSLRFSSLLDSFQISFSLQGKSVELFHIKN